MKRHLTLFGLWSLMAISAQGSGFERKTVTPLPSRYEVSLTEIRERILHTTPDSLRIEKYARETFMFADQSAVQTGYLFMNNLVYTDWESLELYVNAVLQKILPPDLKSDPFIHAYLLKSTSFNAFCTPSGLIFVNIGLFDRIPDEATLAGVLAHEVGHYYLRHSLQAFIRNERGEFSPGVFYSARGAISRFSVKNEYESDSLSYEWMKAAGYDVNGLVKCHRIIADLRNNYLMQFEDISTNKFPTHPEPEKRIERLQQRITRENETSGSYWLTDQTSITPIWQATWPEILALDLDGFNYESCQQHAFYYHLNEPSNPKYVYYLMEGIRRACYLDDEQWKKNFITNNFYTSYELNGKSRRAPMTNGLLDGTAYGVLCLDSAGMSQLPGRFYWENDPKFKTNEEAFVYFFKVGKALGNPECVLSNALSVFNLKEVRNKLLNAYLAYPSVEHRDFAEAWLNNHIFDSLPAAPKYILVDFYAYAQQGQDPIYLRYPGNGDINLMLSAYDTLLTGVRSKNPIRLSDIKHSDPVNYDLFRQLELFSNRRIMARGSRTRLYILDPKYWTVMKAHQTDEFVFLSMMFISIFGPEKSVAAYKNSVETDPMDMIRTSTPKRSFSVIVSSVRNKESGVMKVRSYTGETITRNEDVIASMSRILKNAIGDYEHKALVTDDHN